MDLESLNERDFRIILIVFIIPVACGALIIAIIASLRKEKDTTVIINEHPLSLKYQRNNVMNAITIPKHILLKKNLDKVHLVAGDKGAHQFIMPSDVRDWEGYIEIVNHHNITDTIIIDSQYVDLRVVEYHNTLTTYSNEKTDIFGSVYAFQNKNKITMNLNNYRLKFAFHKGKIFVTGEALIVSSFKVNGAEKA